MVHVYTIMESYTSIDEDGDNFGGTYTEVKVFSTKDNAMAYYNEATKKTLHDLINDDEDGDERGVNFHPIPGQDLVKGSLIRSTINEYVIRMQLIEMDA